MSSTIRVETITIGDELLLGIRENAHLTYLGTQLAHHGLEPAANMVIRDNPEDIGLFFSQAWQRADLVITTGGLGPTTDDITRESIAEALESNSLRPENRNFLKDRFSQLGKPMPEISLRQCRPAMRKFSITRMARPGPFSRRKNARHASRTGEGNASHV